MYIRYNVMTNRVVYVGEKKPLNIDDDYYKTVFVENIPETDGYLTYEKFKVIANNKTNSDKILENNKKRISELKKLLSDSDYKAIKYAEGEITAADYSETRIQRRQYRNELNELGI